MEGRGTLLEIRNEVEAHLRRAARALFALDRAPSEPQPHLEQLTESVEALCATLGPILRGEASHIGRRQPRQTTFDRIRSYGELLDDEARSLLAVCQEAHRLVEEDSFDARALSDLHEVLGEFVAAYHRYMALCRQACDAPPRRPAPGVHIEAAPHRPAPLTNATRRSNGA